MASTSSIYPLTPWIDLLLSSSTSFTTAAYGSHQNVFIRLDPLGRPPSATGSYATIASLNKYPAESKKSCSIFDRKLISRHPAWTTSNPALTGFRSSPTPTPYATALLPMSHDQAAETIYSKPESICPSRISYYASSQLTQVTIPSNTHYPQSQGVVPDGRGLRGMRLGSTFESKPLIYWDTWQAQMEMEMEMGLVMGVPLKRTLLSELPGLPLICPPLLPRRRTSPPAASRLSPSSTIKIKF